MKVNPLASVFFAILVAASCAPKQPAAVSSDAAHAAAPSTKPVEPSPSSPPVSDVRGTVFLGADSGDVPVKVEVVVSEATIQRGLMDRQFLPPDEGMLFVPKVERKHVFWMHNTLIPLDMIFISSDMTIAGIVENAEPRTDTSRFVDKPSLYILEVNGGWCSKHGVHAGAKVRFDGVSAAGH